MPEEAHGGVRPGSAEIERLEPDSAHVHRIRGLIAVSRGDVTTGIRELSRAVEGDRNDVDSLGWLCVLYSLSGLADLAVPLARRLNEIDPFGLFSYMSRVIIQWVRGEFSEGLAVIQTARAAGAESAILEYAELQFMVLSGNVEKALPMFDLFAAQNRDSYFGQLVQFLAHALRGNRSEALRLLETKLAEPSRSDLQYSVEVAGGLAVLGEIDATFDWLENAFSRGFLAYEFIDRHDTLLANARGDPRFSVLVERMRNECDLVRKRLIPAGAPKRTARLDD